MNIVLTSLCNNNCSFCFAKDVLKGDQLFTLNDIKKIVSYHDKGEPIKLLGGEPTMAPNFKEIMEYLSTVKNRIILISNFLFNKEKRDIIKSFCDKNVLETLINVSEADEKKLSIIINNIKELNLPTFSIGFTLVVDKGWNYYKEKLDKFKDFKKFTIRVSLPFPNPKKDNKFYLYKGYDYIELLKKFIKWAVENEKPISLDCGIFPCMLKDQETEDFLIRHLEKCFFGCTGAPADIIDNNTIQFCYPGEAIKINMDRHINASSMMNELAILNKETICTGKLPDECIKCKFLYNKCPGPCLGFIKH